MQNNNYFVNMLTTISLYQKDFVKTNIVNKIKCVHWLNYKKVIGSQRKTRNVTETLTPKIKIELRMKAINYACSKLEESH